MLFDQDCNIILGPESGESPNLISFSLVSCVARFWKCWMLSRKASPVIDGKLTLPGSVTLSISNSQRSHRFLPLSGEIGITVWLIVFPIAAFKHRSQVIRSTSDFLWGWHLDIFTSEILIRFERNLPAHRSYTSLPVGKPELKPWVRSDRHLWWPLTTVKSNLVWSFVIARLIRWLDACAWKIPSKGPQVKKEVFGFSVLTMYLRSVAFHVQNGATRCSDFRRDYWGRQKYTNTNTSLGVQPTWIFILIRS